MWNFDFVQGVDGDYGYQEGQHWEKGQLIGRGISGTCYVARDKATSIMMVVKQV